MSVEFLDTILSEGYKGSLIIFLMVLSYKIFRMKITTESNCFNGCLKVSTDNDGGGNLPV